MKIVVIGGTGLVGAKIVAALRQRGHEVVAAAPSTGVDTITGQGLADALYGAGAVVDVSNPPTLEEQVAMDFFRASGRNLAEAETAAGVGHHLALSIVGTDRLREGGYFRAKIAQEELIKSGPIPFTLIHGTQFFEFIRGIAQAATDGGTVRLPPVQFQPMATDDVGRLIADAALAAPANDVIEIAGPERFTLADAVRRVLAKDGDPREVIADPAARYFGVAVSETALLPGPGARLGSIRFAQWLDHAPPPRADSPSAAHA